MKTAYHGVNETRECVAEAGAGQVNKIGALYLTAVHPALAARRDLTDSHTTHKVVLALCGSPQQRAPGRILWAAPHPGLLLVQSPEPPAADLSVTGWADRQHTADYSHTLATLTQGQSVGYCLIANPTKVPVVDRDRQQLRKRRIPLPPEQRDMWLRRHLDGALAVDTVTGQELGAATGRRGPATVTHLRHLYTGAGTVIDPHTLAARVAAGVGAAKGYGCGLLLITAGGRA